MTQYEQLEKILENKELCEQLCRMDNAEDAYRLLTAEGLDVPQDAFEDLLLALGRAVDEKLGEDELSLDALEDVAGGSGLTIIIGGVTIKMTAAAAAAFGTGFAVGAGVGIAIGLGYLGYRLYKKYKK